MKVALIQSDLIWENPSENLKSFEKKLSKLDLDTELVILPEMFTTGFTMNPENVAETMQGNSVEWMKTTAKKFNIAITGSLVISENENYYNRLFFVTPEQKISYYDKRHLFSLAGEEKKYTSGKERLIINYNNFSICLLICYDLRFPVFSRNNEDFDLLIYVANWPDRRILAWNTLLKARAIENMCYTIGVNRIGLDNNNILHSGNSQAINCIGEYLIEPKTIPGIFYTTLDKIQQNETRKKFGFLNDQDSFFIEN